MINKTKERWIGPDVLSCKTEEPLLQSAASFSCQERDNLLKKILNTLCRLQVTTLAGRSRRQACLILAALARSGAAVGGVDLLAAERRRGRARCVFTPFDLKHLEPDVNHLKTGTHPYNIGKTLLSCFFFFALSHCVCRSHTHRQRHTLGPSNPIPLYLLSCGLGSTCL